VLVEEHELSVRDRCVERTREFIREYWQPEWGSIVYNRDLYDDQGRPNLIISVLSGKGPLPINQRYQKSIAYDIVNVAEEAKGEHRCCMYNQSCNVGLHCASKNIPDVFSYNSRKNCWIFIIFGRDVTEKAKN